MRLFSERYKDLENFPLVTYSEVVEVKYGYTEAEDPNTINILKSRKWGFVEEEAPNLPLEPEDEIPKSEEAPGKPVLEPESPPAAEIVTKPKAEKSKPKPKPKPKGNKKNDKGKSNAALAESDVGALTGRH